MNNTESGCAKVDIKHQQKVAFKKWMKKLLDEAAECSNKVRNGSYLVTTNKKYWFFFNKPEVTFDLKAIQTDYPNIINSYYYVHPSVLTGVFYLAPTSMFTKMKDILHLIQCSDTVWLSPEYSKIWYDFIQQQDHSRLV